MTLRAGAGGLTRRRPLGHVRPPAVASGEIDLAPTHSYEPAEPAPGHGLAADTAPLPLTALAGQPLIGMAPDHPPRREVEAELARAGATPSVLVATPGYALVCAPASAGLGVGVVPERVARTAATPVGVRRLEGGRLRRTIPVVRRTGETAAAADAFRALLRGAFGRAHHH